MYERITKQVSRKNVLEVATGPELLAKYIAEIADLVIAADYSCGMIKEEKKEMIQQT